MKKLLLLLPLFMAGCGPSTYVLYAQTLPLTIHASWNPNPPAENVVKYVLTLDGTPIDEPTATDATCMCVKVPLTIASFGSHSVTVKACNLLVSTDPASFNCGAASMAVNFVVNASPATVPTGGKVGQ